MYVVEVLLQYIYLFLDWITYDVKNEGLYKSCRDPPSSEGIYRNFDMLNGWIHFVKRGDKLAAALNTSIKFVERIRVNYVDSRSEVTNCTGLLGGVQNDVSI